MPEPLWPIHAQLHTAVLIGLIQANDSGHGLIKSVESGTRLGLTFCSLEYFKTVSRELHQALGCQKVLSPSSD